MPPSIVARSQPTAALRFAIFAARTAITMVKLLESRTPVMTVALRMLGHSKGMGQCSLATRT